MQEKNRISTVNIHIYPSNITCETRIEKITKTLAESLFEEIIVIGTKDGETSKDRKFTDRITFLLLGVSNKHRDFLMKLFVFFMFYMHTIVFCVRKKNILCVNAHSLSVLPLCFIISRILNTRLVYDTHELETESNSISGVRKHASKVLEGILIRRSDYTFVVSKSIEQWYKRTYDIVKIETVFNTPSIDYAKIDNGSYFRDKFKIPENIIIYIYVGGMGTGRGVDILLDVFSKVQSTQACLIFMGEGPLVEKVLSLQGKIPVYYHEPVPTSEVVNFSSSADVGVSYIENTSLSHYFSMPNKVFEYLYSSLPVITSNMLDASEFVNSNDIGFVVQDGDELLTLIQKMNPRLIHSKKSNINKVIEQISWEKQEAKIVNVYKSFI